MNSNVETRYNPGITSWVAQCGVWGLGTSYFDAKGDGWERAMRWCAKYDKAQKDLAAVDARAGNIVAGFSDEGEDIPCSWLCFQVALSNNQGHIRGISHVDFARPNEGVPIEITDW